MTLVVEDGTGLSTAEAYISVADASTYHANRGNAAWAALASDTVREQALRKAADYMVQVYRSSWGGNRVNSTQALDWPRANVVMRDGPGIVREYYPSDAVPAAVARACAELALRASAATLIPDEGQAVKRKEVGPVKIEYQDYSRATKTYRAIDNLIEPLLANGGGIRITRS